MPGVAHETVIQLLSEQPQLIGAILDRLGYEVPDGDAKVVDSVLSGLELRPDNVTIVGEGADALAVVTEVQTAPPDHDKWLTWAAYAALAASVHACQSLVLVIARRADTARRCRDGSPFITGPGSHTAVAVIGPNDFADEPPAGFEQARWAVLAVACSAVDLDTPAGRRRALDALADASDDEVGRYNRLILAMASEAAVAALEELVATEYRENLIDRSIAEGRAQGEAIGRQQGATQALLAVLAARGIDVPGHVRDAILECADSDQLDAWVGRAANASALDEVFGDRLSDWL